MSTNFEGGILSDGVPVGGPAVSGNAYYVNGAGGTTGNAAVGNDNNIGSKAEPFATITKALSKCINDNYDVIYVSDYYSPSGETWPISVNKSLLSIIGLQSRIGGMFGGNAVWNVAVASGNFPVFDIVANNVEIAGFSLYAGTTSYAAVTMDSGASVVRLKQCRFVRGTYGVHLTSGDTGYSIVIEDCHFVQGLTTGGIFVDDDPAFLEIRGNYFDRLAGDAIDIVAGAGHIIENNNVAMGANTNGRAITLRTGVNRAWVNNNYAGYGAENGTTSPYLDDGTVGDNAWGRNYFGSNAVSPG